jgi:hypothetical protein
MSPRVKFVLFVGGNVTGTAWDTRPVNLSRACDTR